MLDTTSHCPTIAPPRRVIRGQFLAKNRLTNDARARLAREIFIGTVEVADLTVGQVARLCRVSRARMYRANRTPTDTLVAAWNAASKAHRIEFAQRVGVGVVWDDAVGPAVG